MSSLNQMVSRVLTAGTPVVRLDDEAWNTARVRTGVALGIVLTIALSLRVWGVGFGLPYLYHPDEPSKIRTAIKMLHSGDLNPHYFKKPTLQIYLTAAAGEAYYLFGRAAGWFNDIKDIHQTVWLTGGVGRIDTPGFIVISRLITVAFGVASVGMLFLIVTQLTRDRTIGLLAAAMLAVSPSHVASSRYIHPDVVMLFFLLVVVWACQRILAHGRWRDYALAGIACGLATGSKYNGFFAIALPITAYFVSDKCEHNKDWKLALTFVLAPLAFLATTPYSLIDWQTFIGNILIETIHYANGHPGMEGGAPLWYAHYLLFFEGPIAVLALVQMARCLRRNRREPATMFLMLFPIIYFVIIASVPVRNEQTLLPVMPFLCIFAAMGLADFFRWMTRQRNERVSIAFSPIMGLVAAALLALPLVRVVQANVRLTTTDSRETARDWLEDNIPRNCRVAVESYSAFIDPALFDVRAERFLCVHDPQWYFEQGVEYFVFGEPAFGRFFTDRQRYPEEIAGYEKLFNTLTLVKSFNDGGYEIRVYRSPQVRAPGARPATR